MKHKPYSLYKKRLNNNLVWYVRFWDYTREAFTKSRSTGVEVEDNNEEEAAKIANEMLDYVFLDIPKKTFVEYLESFWKDDSEYMKRHLYEKGKVTKKYIEKNQTIIKLYIKPFKKFGNISMTKITSNLINEWKDWIKDKNVSAGIINKSLLTMSVPYKYAMSKSQLHKVVFRPIWKEKETKTEKGILTKEESSKLLNSEVTNEYDKLAVLLGLLCGLRIGETRGLKFSDVKEAEIIICHNWQNGEGNKLPINKNIRKVPLPRIVRLLVYIIKKNAKDDTLVFTNLYNSSIPRATGYFRMALYRELNKIGIANDEIKKRNLSYQSLRHTFITLGRVAGISDVEIMAMAGFKTKIMIERNSHADQIMDINENMKKIMDNIDK